MKDNLISEFANELEHVAIKYKDCQCLRQALSEVVLKYVPKEIECNSCINEQYKDTNYSVCITCIKFCNWRKK